MLYQKPKNTPRMLKMELFVMQMMIELKNLEKVVREKVCSILKLMIMLKTTTVL